MNTLRNGFIALVICLGVMGNSVAELTELNDQVKLDAIRLANDIAKKAKYLPKDTYENLNNAMAAGTSFSEEQLEKLLKSVMGLMVSHKPENQALRAELGQIQSLLAKKLQSYKVSGFSFAIDPNGAFFVDNQDPEFPVVYKDAEGNVKTRRYKASIDSVGIKVEFAVNFDFIFFTGTASNFYDTNNVIELGKGIEMNLWPLAIANTYLFRDSLAPQIERDINNPAHWIGDPNIPGFANAMNNFFINMISVGYVPFRDLPGGLVLVSFKAGLSGNQLSVITGGTLTPLA